VNALDADLLGDVRSRLGSKGDVDDAAVRAALTATGRVLGSDALRDLTRATRAELTGAGYAALVAAAPGHVRAVREHLFDALTTDQVAQLRTILAAVLDRLPPG
jgi:hypothetical protein